MNDKLPLSPLQLSGNTMIWLDFAGEEKQNEDLYTLKGTTTDPKEIEIRRTLTKQDWINACYSTLMSVIFFFLMLVTALVWVVPTIIFLFIMYIVNTNR
ncbi:hypothetical protein P4361_09575 [Fictibacillus sp. B-59209]|uniref:hypothetical protein n=2 Tax=unclassified Fictibacillus TaxID=2644029 RepID=UPI002E22BB70|nr:hypothetical protein [Fictibacillus sp. B-59209]